MRDCGRSGRRDHGFGGKQLDSFEQTTFGRGAPPKEILLFVRAYEKRLCQDQQSGSASFGRLSDQGNQQPTIFSKHARTRAELLGCLPNFKDLHNLEVTKGRFLTHEDNLIESEVCVVSTALSRTLFPFGDALGQSINIGGNLYEVVGEVAPRFELKDESNQGFKELFEDNVYLPLDTMWSKVFDYYYRGYDGSPLVSKITLTVDDPEKLVTVAQMIRDILASDHGIEDFMVTVPLELMEQAEKAKMTLLLLWVWLRGYLFVVEWDHEHHACDRHGKNPGNGIRRALGAVVRTSSCNSFLKPWPSPVWGGSLVF